MEIINMTQGGTIEEYNGQKFNKTATTQLVETLIEEGYDVKVITESKVVQAALIINGWLFKVEVDEWNKNEIKIWVNTRYNKEISNGLMTKNFGQFLTYDGNKMFTYNKKRFTNIIEHYKEQTINLNNILAEVEEEFQKCTEIAKNEGYCKGINPIEFIKMFDYTFSRGQINLTFKDGKPNVYFSKNIESYDLFTNEIFLDFISYNGKLPTYLEIINFYKEKKYHCTRITELSARYTITKLLEYFDFDYSYKLNDINVNLKDTKSSYDFQIKSIDDQFKVLTDLIKIYKENKSL